MLVYFRFLEEKRRRRRKVVFSNIKNQTNVIKRKARDNVERELRAIRNEKKVK